MNVDLLIGKVLQGEATAGEKEAFRAWLEASKENEQLFEAMQAFYTKPLPKQEQRDKSRWEQTLGKIYEQGEGKWIFDQKKTRVPLRKGGNVKRLGRHYFSGVAAAIFFIAVAGAAFWWGNSSNEQLAETGLPTSDGLVHSIAEKGIKKVLTLPDGTEVKLNSGSQLTMPAKFSAHKREVFLEGEAFFDVARDTARPFIIHANDFDVEVLGTSFNVSAYQGQGAIPSVAVVEGKVKVEGQKIGAQAKSEVVLTKGQMTKPSVDGLAIEALDPRLIAWKDNILLIDTQSFEEIIDKVENWYGVEIEVKKSIFMGEGYKGRFQDATLESVMENMGFALDFRFRFDPQDKKVVIW